MPSPHLNSLLRFSLSAHREASTKAGRRYGKLNEGDEIVMVAVAANDKDGVLAATSDGHALGVPVKELALLSGVFEKELRAAGGVAR